MTTEEQRNREAVIAARKATKRARESAQQAFPDADLGIDIRGFASPAEPVVRRRVLVGVIIAIAIAAVLVGAAFLSRADAQIASANHDRGSAGVQQKYKCQRKIAALVNPSQMSSTTARRTALKICTDLKLHRPYFYRAMTLQP